MAIKTEELFDDITVKKICSKITLTQDQKDAAMEWIGLLDAEKLVAEKQSQPKFEQIILQRLLGYSLYDYTPEVDGIDYVAKIPSSDKTICIEVKGQNQGLQDYQDRDTKNKQTPLAQTWTYVGYGHDYGVCSNFREFILVTSAGTKTIHKFNFLSIKKSEDRLDEDKLKEFVGIFSKEEIFTNNSVEHLVTASQLAQQEFTGEFYKLFHETRLMLIREFETSPEISRKQAIHWAQIFLNRLIFIFFVEDNNFIPDRLFAKRIIAILNSPSIDESTQKIFDDILGLFKIMNKGSDIQGVNGFNGGLFGEEISPNITFPDLRQSDFFNGCHQNSKLSVKSTIVDVTINSSGLYGEKLNPLIKNLLVMDSYDFTSDLNVNILGHIFEQSISDVESLQSSKSAKRKKDGVYYTPDSLTDYICRNTIIPFLSNTGNTSVLELVDEYTDNLEKLEEKIKQLKILDPACGSGAFLIKSVDILLEIDEEIQFRKPGQPLQTGLDQYTKTKEIHLIIENNIYGVDVNEESIEITKLSLFLKLAGPKNKLGYLSKNIKVGNSLIDDPSFKHSFSWEKQFPHIFLDSNLQKHIVPEHVGGFDIIVGNPPWEILKPDVDEFFTPLYNDGGNSDKFSLLKKPQKNVFMEKCLSDKQIHNEWKTYLDEYQKQMTYFIETDNYEHQISEIDGKKYSRVDINLYKLFVEKSFQLLKLNGICGMVLPSGIYSDLGTKSLRQLIFEKSSILEICGFINKKGIFEDIHKQFKFCTLLFKKGHVAKEFLAKFRAIDISELKNFRETGFVFDLNLIKMSSPDSLTIIECKNQEDQKILKKIYQFPLIKNHKWNFKASREFHMTDDSHLFHTGNIGLPLYEGKMIDMFNDNFKLPRYWVDKKQGFEKLQKKEMNKIKKFTKKNKITPQIHPHEYRLVWRTITNSIDKRTLIATILPPNVFLGHSLNYLNPTIFNQNEYEHPISYDETVFLCGLFNSFVVDFVLRHKIATNLTIFQILELPIPRFDKNNILHKKVLKNSVMLICKTDDYCKLRKETGISDIADESQYIPLEAQINACVAKIYGLTRQELEFILQIFTIEDTKLKELTLDEFDLLL